MSQKVPIVTNMPVVCRPNIQKVSTQFKTKISAEKRPAWASVAAAPWRAKARLLQAKCADACWQKPKQEAHSLQRGRRTRAS